MQVRNVEGNADNTIRDPMDNPLPPCIVMERGESLDLWAERAQPDRSMAFTVCLPSAYLRALLVAKRLSYAACHQEVVSYVFRFEITAQQLLV